MDLVVRKVAYGKNAEFFDVTILRSDPESDSEDEAEPDSDDEEFDFGEESYTGGFGEALVQEVNLGETLPRAFKKRPVLVNDLRKVTAKQECAGKPLRIRLD